jgi:hypothetical protein
MVRFENRWCKRMKRMAPGGEKKETRVFSSFVEIHRLTDEYSRVHNGSPTSNILFGGAISPTNIYHVYSLMTWSADEYMRPIKIKSDISYIHRFLTKTYEYNLNIFIGTDQFKRNWRMNSCSGLFGEASAPHSASILKSKTAGLSTSWHASCMLDIYNRSSLINPMIESIHLKFHYTTLFLNDDGRVQEYIFRKKKECKNIY